MDTNDPFASDPDAAAPEPAPVAPASGSRTRKVLISVALVVAGMLIGGAVTGVAVASVKGGSSHGASHGEDRGPDHHDGGGPHPQELTGDALTKVTDAVVVRYPGATIERAFQTPDGGYLAHVETADGEKYVVLDAKYTVTGEQAGPRAPGGPRPDGDRDHGKGGITLPSDGAVTSDAAA